MILSLEKILVPVLQKRNLGLREAIKLPQGHAARQPRSLDLNPESLALRS